MTEYNLKRIIPEPKTEYEQFMDFIKAKEKQHNITISYTVKSTNGKIVSAKTDNIELYKFLLAKGFE